MQVNRRADFALSRSPGAPATLDRVRDWRSQAACLEIDPELFFPGKDDPEMEAAALAACAGCPVRAQCLAGALDRDERFGIWGGETEAGRRKLLRERQAAERRVRGLTARGGRTWAVSASYRGPDGRRAQLATTVTGSQDEAMVRLGQLQKRAAELAELSELADLKDDIKAAG